MSLVGHWRFEGDTTDSAGKNDGSGSPTYVDGKIGQGIEGDGSTITVPRSESIDSAFTGDEMTLSMWWKQDDQTDSARWRDAISMDGYRLERGYADSDPEADYWCNLGSGDGGNLYNGSIGVPSGEWFHILIRRNGNDFEAWINGELDDSRTTTSDITLAGDLNFNPHNTGSQIDDIRLYDHAISEKEIHQLSQAKLLHYKFDKQITATENLADTSSGALGENRSASGWDTFSVDTSEYTTDTRHDGTEKDVAHVKWSASGSGGIRFGRMFPTNINVEPNTTYTYSYYIKLAKDYEHDNFIYVRQDASDGSDITNNGEWADRKQEYVGYGWRRIWATFTTDSNTDKLRVDHYAYDGDGNEVWFYGAQLEKRNGVTEFTKGVRTGTVTDCSGQGNDSNLTVANSPRWDSNNKVGTGAYDFDGNVEYIETNEPVPGGDPEVTLSAWAKANTTNQDSWTGIICLGTNQSTNTSFMITTGGNGNNIELHTWSNSTSGVSIDTNWHHFAAVNTGNGEQRFYVDGELIDSMNQSLSIPSETGTIGTRRYAIEDNNTTRFWNGLIDDARMYATAFSGSEIKALYEQRASIDDEGGFHSHELSEEISDGLSLYAESAGNNSPTSGFSELRVNGSEIGATGRGINVLEINRSGDKLNTESFDVYGSATTETDKLVSFIESADSGSVLLFAADDHPGRIENDGVAAIESLGSQLITDVQDGGRNSWAFICTKGVGPHAEKQAPSGEGPVLAEHDLPDSMDLQNTGTLEADISEVGPAAASLIAWWPLNGDTDDYAGSNNTSVNVGDPSVSSGLGQSAYKFSEANNGDELRSDKLDGVDPDRITMSAWINPNDSADSRSSVFRGGGDVYLQHYSNDRIATYWYGWDDTGYHYSSSGSVPTGEWSHILVTWEPNGEIKFYVNGSLDKTVTGVGNGGGDPASSDAKIGRESSSRRFDGKIQDVRIYDRALTAEEVETLYNITDPRTDQHVIEGDTGEVYTKGEFDETL